MQDGKVYGQSDGCCPGPFSSETYLQWNTSNVTALGFPLVAYRNDESMFINTQSKISVHIHI